MTNMFIEGFHRIPKAAWGDTIYDVFSNKNQDSDFFKKDIFQPNTTFSRTAFEESINADESTFSYSLNSYGYRSDEFDSEHRENDVLFAGCSFTFGEGLPINENWSGQIYEYFKNSGITDRYLSVSYPGGSINLIVHSIFKYLEMFNKPKTIMMLVPDAERSIFFDSTHSFSINPVPNNFDKDIFWKSFDNAIMNSWVTIRQLEILCKYAGIRFIWSAWNPEQQEAYKHMKFTNYLYMNDELIHNNINYGELGNFKYIEKARDRAHPGAAYFNGVKNLFLKEYNETA